MRKAIFRRSFGARVRRFSRRRAFWMLTFVALGCVIIWREEAARRPEARPAMVALDIRQYPPIADKPVRLPAGKQKLLNVLNDLSRQAGVRFNVDWEELRSAGIDSSVVFDVRDNAHNMDPSHDWHGLVPLKDALRMALAGSGGADFSLDPIYISRADELNSAKRQVIVMYPVEDILQVNSPWVYRQSPEDRRGALATMVEFTVEPRVWAVEGGFARLTVDDDGHMFVTAAPGIQYQVKQVLAALRRK